MPPLTVSCFVAPAGRRLAASRIAQSAEADSSELQLGARAMSRALDRDRKRGWPKIETALRRDPALPASFQANPAQHFFALQNVLAERRRQQWREECDREPDSFGLAA